MSKPLYEDVKRKCLTCGGEIGDYVRTGNYCSKVCWRARQMKDQTRKIKRPENLGPGSQAENN